MRFLHVTDVIMLKVGGGERREPARDFIKHIDHMCEAKDKEILQIWGPTERHAFLKGTWLRVLTTADEY